MAKQPNDVVSGAYPLYGNKFIQFGRSAFTTTESDASIRTNLTTIEMGIAQTDDTYGITNGTDAQFGMIAVEPVVTSGAFLVVRDTGGAAALSAQTFSYMIIGNIDATD